MVLAWRPGTRASQEVAVQISPKYDTKSIAEGISKEYFFAVPPFGFPNILPEHVLVDEWFEIIRFGDWCSHQAGFLQSVSFRMSQPHPEGPIFKIMII